LAGVPTAWIPAFADAGVLVPWTDKLDASFLSGFERTLVDGGKIGGKLMALPYLSTSRALFWNRSEFKRAGLSGPPTTWDELIADARRIEASGAAKSGFALQGTGNETFAAWFPPVYWSYGGKLVGSDGKLAIDRDACMKGVSILQKLVAGKLTQRDVTASDVAEQLKLFTSGGAAMTITGPWLIGTLAKEAKDLDYGVAPIPAGTESSTLDVADAYVLFKDAKNAQAAAAFAKFLFEPANADQFVEGRGMLPVLRGGFDAPRYAKAPLRTFVDLVRKGQFVPMDADWLKLLDSGTRALQAMYVDRKSPADTCNAIGAGLG
jgi:multiple sugar transport system substrate-binding protein